MTAVRAFFLAALLAIVAPQAPAQSLEIPPPILTIDQDRLFSETKVGLATRQELEERAATLAEENHAIETQLVEEERALTDLRPTLEPEEFRSRADAFDAKVKRIRAEQDEKARAINRAREEARQTIIASAAEVISSIVRERGALVVLDRRDVFLSADSIDITEETIRRLNEANAENP